MTEKPTLANPKPWGVELKIPVYKDLVSMAQNLGDGKLRCGDVTSVIDLHLGILNTALDPLGAIISSAVDFLMNLLVENIKPLGDAVNWLLGDPKGIQAVSQSWNKTADAVATSGNSYIESLGQLSTWEGPAAETYKGVVRHAHGVYEEAADSARGVAGAVGLGGAIVSMFREFLWGMLVDFVTEVIKAAVAAVLAAIPSAGGSVAAFTAWFSGKMALIAGKFSKTLSKLMTKMGDLCQKFHKSGRSFHVAAEKLRQLAKQMGHRSSQGFGRSKLNIGKGGAPKLPLNNMDEFKQNTPGYDTFNDVYKHGKRATAAADKAANSTPPTELQDLPEGY
ncbi:MAG: hypothetical protein Q4G45_06105 [Actinomycetia bacterium]|nr:hypothetical protein [Actinomycetes bacterium]